MAKSRKDLLLAKRRVLAMLPFICINFSFAIVMLVFSAIGYYRVYTINDDYQIYPENFTENNIISLPKCTHIKNNMYQRNFNHNFTQIFELDIDHGKNDVTLEKFIDSISVGFAFSITAVLFLFIFLIIAIVFYSKYVVHSDEVIKANPEHLSNRNHWVTTCFMIFKIVSIILIEIYLVISALISISYQSEVFDPVHYYYDNCLIEQKEAFKNEYEYCWGLNSKLAVFYIFTALFVFTDILSIIVAALSKNYNVWSFLLNKISRGKYPYEEVDINKGFIIPQASVVKDDEAPEEDLIAAINEVDDDQ